MPARPAPAMRGGARSRRRRAPRSRCPRGRRRAPGTTASARAATRSSAPGAAIRSTSSSAPAASGSSSSRAAASRTADSDSSPSAIAPASLLCRRAGEESLSATGKPIAAAATDAPTGSAAVRAAGTGMPAAAISVFASASREPSAVAARRPRRGCCGGDRPQPLRVPGRAPQLRRTVDRRDQSLDRGEAAPGELADDLLADQVGEGGGEERCRRRPLGAVGEALASGSPARLGLAPRATRACRGRSPSGRSPGRRRPRRRSRRAARARPRSATCSRAGCRSSPPPAAALEPLPARRAQRRQLEPDPVGLVGGDAGVAARAGQEREPAGAVRSGARLGEDPSELEQLVRVARPAGAGLLDQRPEDPLVPGQRAGVRGRRAGAGLRGADLEDHDADPALGAAGERGGEALRRHRRIRGTSRSSARPSAALSAPSQSLGVADRLVAGRDDGVKADARGASRAR